MTTLVIQQGFQTKTQLQRLSEGYLDFQEPKTNKKSKSSDDVIITDDNNDKKIKPRQLELEIEIQEQRTTLFNFSDYECSKSTKLIQNVSKNKKTVDDTSRFNLINNLTNFIQYLFNKFLYN